MQIENDPNRDGQSDLSPYLHFGQIGASRVAMEVVKSMKKRRSISGRADRAQGTLGQLLLLQSELRRHPGFPGLGETEPGRACQRQTRVPLRSRRAGEGKTHDDLWNAAQLEMVRRGKMHGYMRMYWAKKILEWTESPAEALRTVIYLNDRYELDGRDPNGYVGAAWSLGGVHDRAWKERAIYGKVRYMSYNGSKRKFDVQAYIDTWKRDALQQSENQA